MLLFFAGLCLLVFFTARHWFGTVSGFFALILVAFEPTLLAHAGIVHTDVPISLFWLASILAWGGVLSHRSFGRIVAAGLFLGLALATKFSAVYLFPTLALASMASRALEAKEGDPSAPIHWFGSALLRDIGALSAAAAIALGVALVTYQPVVSGFTVTEQQAVIHRMIGVYERAPLLAERLAAISFSSKALAHLAAGIAIVARQNAIGGGITFLNGRISTQGFPTYFYQAFAVKTGLPLIASVAVAAALARRRRLDRSDALLWIPVVYYFVFSMGSSYNIGIRHVLPVYPLLAIAACRSVASPRNGHLKTKARTAALTALGVLLVAQVSTAVSAHPFELSYFNLFGGGTSGGYRRLADSNTDWGLDLRRLSAELSRRRVRDATICYFGGDRVYPRTGIVDFAAYPRVHGDLVAISTSLWDIGPAFYAVNGRMDLARDLARLIRALQEHGEPVGRIGGSTLLYRLPETFSPADRSPNSGILGR
jgi:4-amino-4-deoxy-L-arabinose transferase-like glycosyltransferase